jgi:aminoglycoside 3-N-acetyltransferase
MSAVGARADWITRDHPMRYGYGPGSPLAKLCEIGGQACLLGAPLDAITLLHHAEHLADLPDKRIFRNRCPVLQHGQTVWLDMEDFETGENVIDAEYTFDVIARDYMTAHGERSGMVGNAKSYLFDTSALVRFAVEWLEARFGVK